MVEIRLATPVPSAGATPVKCATLLIGMNFTGHSGAGTDVCRLLPISAQSTFG